MALALRPFTTALRLSKVSPLVLPRIAPRQTYSTKPRITTKMSDDEQKQSDKLDLTYTPDRAEELKENIEGVQKEIDEAWAEVQSQGGSKVSLSRFFTLANSVRERRLTKDDLTLWDLVSPGW